MTKKFYFIIFIVLILLGLIIFHFFLNNGAEFNDDISIKQNTQNSVLLQNNVDENAAADKESTQKIISNQKNLFGNAKYLICIHKLSYELDLYEKGTEIPIRTFPIAVAKNNGDKERPGDNKTPVSWGNIVSIPSEYDGADVGVKSSEVPFRVEEICDASTWAHDFNDGKGVIEGAYGPWFISLDTGWDGIGIHGTHDPNSIGTNASEGCIRLLNKDIIELKEIISTDNGGIGTRVIITED